MIPQINPNAYIEIIYYISCMPLSWTLSSLASIVPLEVSIFLSPALPLEWTEILMSIFSADLTVLADVSE